MDMSDVVEVCESVGVAPQSGPLGVQVGTTGWRLECGSWIAGNGHEWWLRVIAGAYHPKAPDVKAAPIGPLRTRSDLKRALLAKWKHWYTEIRLQTVPVCDGCGDRVDVCGRCGAPMMAGDKVACIPGYEGNHHSHFDKTKCAAQVAAKAE